MKILSHRGLWYEDLQKNTTQAFQESFSLGFGTETDIRDYQGRLVVSHDIAGENAIPVEKVFEIYRNYNKELFLALNIKSDGLQAELKKLLDEFGIKNYFVFDMSVPEGIKYFKSGFNAFTRHSEYENSPSFYEDAKGVWIDCFKGDWIDEDIIRKHLDNGKMVCVVSPDLHKREYKQVWKKYLRLVGENNFLLCTDYPKQAKEFFNLK
jgi:glycerophosphoryl diester phosphodiesterase